MPSMASDQFSRSTDPHTFSSDLGHGESEKDSAARRGLGSISSDSDCMSTEGEESDPSSPLTPGLDDKQKLNQSEDLKAALLSSRALSGDYIELKNCKRCGSMIFKVIYTLFNSSLFFLLGLERCHKTCFIGVQR